ncbi:hypothetical protein FPOAC1_008181 [Fusarium poae]|uniref:hypothetical protein n=1 Tax=Fusarium poae TaxID=36050 RepID=UPI001CE8B2E4|nr:hypothetical protein FPOAC1_008181 [Fusarium poae]KAG8668797.1 hypothetical protein FPOAC1_008181 [Fusarium poae]
MAHPFVTSSHLLHRSFAQKPEMVIYASGVSLFLESGREVLDASAGPAVSCLGFGRPEIVQVVTNQINQLAYLYSGARFTCDVTEDLASMLLQGQPGGLSKATFVNSGSEATDAAIKLATQYWFERGMPQKCHVIARKQSYHGNTTGALCVSGHDSRRTMYRPWLSQNEEILRFGPEKVSAFVAETVSGTTLGCVPVVIGYWKAIRQMFDAIAEGTGGLTHGQSFQAHPVAYTAALEVQRIIRDERILTNVKKWAQCWSLFWAVEFVQDFQNKTPFPASMRLCHRIVDKSLDLALNILGNLGQTGDVHVDHVIMSPPYVVTESDLERMVGILQTAIQVVVSKVVSI